MPGAERIDEAVADDRQHLIEEAGAVARALFLDDEGGAHEREGDEGDQGERSWIGTCLQGLLRDSGERKYEVRAGLPRGSRVTAGAACPGGYFFGSPAS